MVRGGGDLGSGVALRLWRVGFRVVILEVPSPVAVRRTVCFAEAVYSGAARVEEATGALVTSPPDALRCLRRRTVAVVVDPRAQCLNTLQPAGLVDAIMAKRNTGTSRDMARCVVGLGPGFGAGEDVHAVIETNRGPDLGRVIWSGQAEPDTGEPGAMQGRTVSRVLRAPVDGALTVVRQIGDIVEEGETVASVAGVPIAAPFHGLVRGLAREGLRVSASMKIGDLDPRLDPSLCFRVSDKALAVAGGVLEAVLMLLGDRHG